MNSSPVAASRCAVAVNETLASLQIVVTHAVRLDVEMSRSNTAIGPRVHPYYVGQAGIASNDIVPRFRPR